MSAQATCLHACDRCTTALCEDSATRANTQTVCEYNYNELSGKQMRQGGCARATCTCSSLEVLASCMEQALETVDAPRGPATFALRAVSIFLNTHAGGRKNADRAFASGRACPSVRHAQLASAPAGAHALCKLTPSVFCRRYAPIRSEISPEDALKPDVDRGRSLAQDSVYTGVYAQLAPDDYYRHAANQSILKSVIGVQQASQCSGTPSR